MKMLRAQKTVTRRHNKMKIENKFLILGRAFEEV